MNYFLTALIAISFSHKALACTKSDSKAQSKLIEMFQLNGSPVDWVSVKTSTNDQTRVKTIRENRSFPVTVEASRRISSSRIKYKRDTYDLRNAKICFQGSKILIVHPEGELVVARRGRDLKTSEISLEQNGGLFNLRLRPRKLLGSKKAVTL